MRQKYIFVWLIVAFIFTSGCTIKEPKKLTAKDQLEDSYVGISDCYAIEGDVKRDNCLLQKVDFENLTQNSMTCYYTKNGSERSECFERLGTNVTKLLCKELSVPTNKERCYILHIATMNKTMLCEEYVNFQKYKFRNEKSILGISLEEYQSNDTIRKIVDRELLKSCYAAGGTGFPFY